MNAPEITRHEDGRLTIDGFTDPLLISPELLFMDTDYIQRLDDASEPWAFRLTFSNGTATYRVIGWEHHAIKAELVECDGPRKGESVGVEPPT